MSGQDDTTGYSHKYADELASADDLSENKPVKDCMPGRERVCNRESYPRNSIRHTVVDENEGNASSDTTDDSLNTSLEVDDLEAFTHVCQCREHNQSVDTVEEKDELSTFFRFYVLVYEPLDERCLEGKAEGCHGAHEYDIHHSVALLRIELIGSGEVKLTVVVFSLNFFLENAHHDNGR